MRDVGKALQAHFHKWGLIVDRLDMSQGHGNQMIICVTLGRPAHLASLQTIEQFGRELLKTRSDRTVRFFWSYSPRITPREVADLDAITTDTGLPVLDRPLFAKRDVRTSAGK